MRNRLQLVKEKAPEETYQTYESKCWREFFDRAGIPWEFTPYRGNNLLPEYSLPKHGFFHVMTAYNFTGEDYIQSFSDLHNSLVHVVYEYPRSEDYVKDGYIHSFAPSSWGEDARECYVSDVNMFLRCDICNRSNVDSSNYNTMKQGCCNDKGRNEGFVDCFDFEGYRPDDLAKLRYLENMDAE